MDHKGTVFSRHKHRSHALIYTRYVNFTYMYNLHSRCVFGYVNAYMKKLICTCVNVHSLVNIHMLRPDVLLVLV